MPSAQTSRNAFPAHVTRGELKSLTALRGVAAMAVVMQHFSATAQGYCRETIPSLVPHGYVGVDFFFVLSGFIMAYNYADEFQQRGRAAFAPFLAKRVARIVPLNAAVLLGLLGAGLASVALTGRNIFFSAADLPYDILANLFMLQGLGIGRNLNGPSWSISTEFSAYLLCPMLIMLTFGSRARVAATAALGVAALCLLAMTRPRLALSFDDPPYSLVRCFAEFALGMAACRMAAHAGAARVLRRDAAAFGLAGAAAALLAARVDLPAVLLLPFIVAAFALNTGRAARLAQWRFFYFLGMISFSLYLIHSPFRPLATHLLRAVAPEPVGPGAALVFALAGSLLVIFPAWATYVWIERPGRRWGRMLSGAATRREPVADQPMLRPAP